MSKRDPRVTLLQIREAAGRIQTICAGKTMPQLLTDWQATAALERFLEILGEAVKRLPADLRERHPGVPWKEIAGTRDRLSHGYDDVNHEVLWNAAMHDIPVLVATVEKMLKELGPAPHG